MLMTVLNVLIKHWKESGFHLEEFTLLKNKRNCNWQNKLQEAGSTTPSAISLPELLETECNCVDVSKPVQQTSHQYLPPKQCYKQISFIPNSIDAATNSLKEINTHIIFGIKCDIDLNIQAILLIMYNIYLHVLILLWTLHN